MKRALIELDGIVDTGFCGQYERFKNTHNLSTGLSDFFDTIITEAYENKLAVWTAILNHDEIWVSSCFIGDSGRLLISMLDSADKYQLSDKVVINMRNSDDVYSHMPPDADVLIDRLKLNNIRFIYADDAEYENYLP